MFFTFLPALVILQFLVDKRLPCCQHLPLAHVGSGIASAMESRSFTAKGACPYGRNRNPGRP